MTDSVVFFLRELFVTSCLFTFSDFYWYGFCILNKAGDFFIKRKKPSGSGNGGEEKLGVRVKVSRTCIPTLFLNSRKNTYSNLFSPPFFERAASFWRRFFKRSGPLLESDLPLLFNYELPAIEKFCKNILFGNLFPAWKSNYQKQEQKGFLTGTAISKNI